VVHQTGPVPPGKASRQSDPADSADHYWRSGGARDQSDAHEERADFADFYQWLIEGFGARDQSGAH
jgi:hypothetical protein